ncbi:MAG: hAT transposon family protein [Candidatus Thiodiazotropha sp.]
MAEKQATKKIYDFPGHAKSPVWKHFGFYAFEENDGPVTLDKTKAICRYCLTTIKYTGNTTNLQNHVDKKHGTFVEQKSTTKQPTLTQCFSSQAKLSFHSDKAMEITQAIGEHLVLDLRPISSVESKSFRNILSKAEPRYSVPSRTYFKDTLIPKLYEKTKADIVKELKEAKGGVSITTDCWTSSATESYMTVTAHFVSKENELKSYVLQTRTVDDRHTAENLASELEKCANEWGLERPTVVSDNAANILKAVRLLNWRSIPCLAHTINLAAKSGLKVQQVSKLLAKARDIVSYFKRNAYAMTVLHKKQVMLNLPQLSLINDVDTRWNSTYDMLERLLSQTAAIHATFSEPEIKKERAILLSADEHMNAEELIVVLKTLKTATTIICEQYSPSISMILPVLSKLRRSLTVLESDSNMVKAVKTATLTNLNQRYLDRDLYLHLVACTLLDPRYKDMPMDENTKLDAANLITESASVFSSMPQVAPAVVKTEPESQSSEKLPPLPTLPLVLTEQPATVNKPDSQMKSEEEHEVCESEIPCKIVKSESQSSFLDDWFSDVVIVKVEKKPSEISDIVQEEIKRYLPSERISADTDPLKWWNVQAMFFPHLANVAKIFLATPATSVPSERVFSAAGYTVNKQRSSLASENVDRLIFLNKNYKRQMSN